MRRALTAGPPLRSPPLRAKQQVDELRGALTNLGRRAEKAAGPEKEALLEARRFSLGVLGF